MSGVVFISSNEDVPLKSIINKTDNFPTTSSQSLEAIVCDALDVSLESFDEVVCKTLLVRTTTDGRVPGMHAYHLNIHYAKKMNKKPNIRATRFSMALGLYRVRFYGAVVLVREGKMTTPLINDISLACNVSPDLRRCVMKERGCNDDDHMIASSSSSSAQEAAAAATSTITVPDWIANAAMHSYHDEEALSQLAAAMKNIVNEEDEESSTSDQSREGDDAEAEATNDDDSPSRVDSSSQQPLPKPTSREFVARSPLCFHCRGPAQSLCPGCNAVYFCDSPRNCHTECWSHDCQCETWRLYERRRKSLSTFRLGPWHQELMGRDFQLAQQPYEKFLVERLAVIKDVTANYASWWMTELEDAWSGGQSEGAKTIDVETRCSYQQGFHPIVDIPPERPLSDKELEQCSSYCDRNQVGFLRLQSWRDYYRLRGIPESSPVALLLTFPLTLYYGITEYGEVPCTVARMLKRPLRVHLVGCEKELKLLDLFKEVAYLMPSDVSLELVFIVRDDMLPQSLQTSNKRTPLDLVGNLRCYIASGTYGDSIDPNFDCGSGAPDIIMAFNAGLYAYESWRSVIRFLHLQRGVLGIFTDYNEYSGVGCAALGGAKSRESLYMNPFRQPRAMPVYSMNLPQFSNGFLYVYNQQELD